MHFDTEPPYYAVIFTAQKNGDRASHDAMAARLTSLVQGMPGFLGIEYAESERCIMVSYWESKEAIQAWMAHSEHQAAKDLGKETWYETYAVRICLVENQYGS